MDEITRNPPLRNTSPLTPLFLSAAGDPVDFLQKVGAKADQPKPDLLRKAAKLKGEKLALQGMAEWLGAAVGGRTTPSKAPTKGKKVKFDTFSDSEDAAAEDEPDKDSDDDSVKDSDKESDADVAPKLVPKKQQKKKPVTVDEDSDSNQAEADASPPQTNKKRRKAATAAAEEPVAVSIPKRKRSSPAGAAEEHAEAVRSKKRSKPSAAAAAASDE